MSLDFFGTSFHSFPTLLWFFGNPGPTGTIASNTAAPAKPAPQHSNASPNTPGKPTIKKPSSPSTPGKPATQGPSRPSPSGKQTPHQQLAPQKATPIPDKENKSFFALIIGINQYADALFPVLHGAVADAIAMRDFLKDILKVPESNIRLLTDSKAKRADIMKGFSDLQNDQRIKKGDPILIFFAGHGGETPAPDGWQTGDVEKKIQMIIPKDFCSNKTAGLVYGIPDISIGALIDGIEGEKGDNITVIFDSCNSGSGTRKSKTDEGTVRGASLANPPPPDIDHDLLGTHFGARGSRTVPGFARKGLSSHVLLAACNQKEEAQERLGRGRFSKALMHALVDVGVDKLTYASLLDRMDKIPGQNPQCEGVNRNRILFNSKAPSSGRICFRISMEGSKYTLQAGSVHGVTTGAEFTVYKDNPSIIDSTPLGVLVVHSSEDVLPFSTHLSPKVYGAVIRLPPVAYAAQSKAGEAERLVVVVPFDKRLKSLYEAFAKDLQNADPRRREIRFAKHGDPDARGAKLALSITPDGEIAFDILDARLTEYNIRQMHYTVRNDPKDIMPVLNSAAHFYWYLDREKKDGLVNTPIKFEFFELSSSEDKIEPKTDENLYKNAAVELVSSPKIAYGFKVTNNSKRDLYLNAFYFDNSDFSISSVYQSTTSGQFEAYPTLPKNGGFIPVGYGDSGIRPFAYSIEQDDVEIDVGFLMLFITSTNVDLSMIPQETPFVQGRKMTQVDVTDKKEPELVYGTILIPIIIRRE